MKKNNPSVSFADSSLCTREPLGGGMKEKKRSYSITHPTLGTINVLNVRDKLEAVQKAAKTWGGLQWSRLARECIIQDCAIEEVEGNDLDGEG